LNRREFLKTAVAFSATAVSSSSSSSSFFNGLGLSPEEIELVRVRVRRPDLPRAFEGMTIALLTDLHQGSPGVRPALIERAAEIAMSVRPDLICLGGDFISGWGARGDIREFLSIVRGLAAPMGVFAVLGNHEFMSGPDLATRSFDHSSIRLLRNEVVTLHKDHQQLDFIGLDNYCNQPLKSLREQIERVSGHPGSLILEHSPDLAPMLGPAFDGLILCGHTHGGQIMIPMLGQIASSSRFGQKYVAGLYPVGRGVMYISRGVGAVVIPMRIGCPPEVTVLELRSGVHGAA